MRQTRHPGAIRSLVIAALLCMGMLIALTVLGPLPTAVAQSPTEECGAAGLEYLDKIDSINGSGDYTSDEGFDYTVTVTDNPNPTPDSYTLSPTPAASGYYPGYTNITELPKFGEGGGLSHITICGLQGEQPTATVPAATSTVPAPTATLPPGVTPTDVPPTATLAPGVTPTATGVTVNALPETGASGTDVTSAPWLLLTVTAAVVLTAGAVVVRTGRD